MDSSTWNAVELMPRALRGIRLVRLTGLLANGVAGRCEIRSSGQVWPIIDRAEIKIQLFKLIKSHGLDVNVSRQTDNEGSEVPSGKSSVFIRTW